MIDLRSDTVTLPTPEMREAIARAELGDDVYGEDPTVNRLEAMAASMLGKEAAVLVASGTMGNLIAMLTHCPRGTKAIVGAEAHTYFYEAGGASALGGIILTPVRNSPDGELDTEELAREIGAPHDDHFAEPSLVALENTHNRCGGAPVKLSHMDEVRDLARKRSLPVHLDGARIFNAAIALETSAKEIAGYADTVCFCLSKGLACPVGSLLCGSREFIGRAKRTRKVLGGGMRQAGIIAAAGIVALTSMVDRLAEDHQNARALAQGLGLVAGINVKPAAQRTNMVFFEV
ncbi:MAG TPA: low-specificity L-threonine aldolase, partial [Candidatus Binataceae bacterium]|nr:low-specificity L-threonine aldolase [Candidatus Binataceae bacterium]